MNIRLICIVFLLISIVFAPTVLAKENPYKNAGKAIAHDIPVQVESDTVTLTDTSKVKLNGAEYTHTIGRVSITMKPQIQGLSKNSRSTGNSLSVGDSPTVTYEFYQDLIKEQVVLNSPETVKYSYDVGISDWVTEEPDLSRPEITMDANNTEMLSYPYTTQVTNYAKDSTRDIILDSWGNLIVTVNGEDVVVIPKPFTTDATGRRFDLDFELDKENSMITVIGDMTGAEYPVTIDPSERVTNGGFETGTTGGWSATGNPSLKIISGGASSGNYYCLYRGNGIWFGTGGYNRIYQTIDYTGMTSVSMAVKFFQYNRYDYVFSDGFWNEPRNWVVSFPGQHATGWVTKSATPSLTGQNLIQVWTYGGTTAGIDSISTVAEGTQPVELTYSVTNVESFSGKMNLYPSGTNAYKNIQLYFRDPWKKTSYKADGSVTKADFGSSGLATSTFHYHFGHGDLLPYGTGIRLTDGYVMPPDVFRAWNGKNKWVLIDACNILSDPNWGNAMVTTHGVLGFATEKPKDWQIPGKFLPKVVDGSMTVYNAYRKATEDSYHGEGVKAAIIFRNRDQFETDHFPPGFVAPDGSPNDRPVYKVWDV